MNKVIAISCQVLLYALFAATVGRFATMPPYRYADADMASIKLSLSHAADRIEPCVPLTADEIRELAQNMRRTETCERQRMSLYVEIDIDGVTVASVAAEPSGIWNDGPSSVYERFEVAPGRHTVAARLRDTARTEGWDYERAADVDLVPGRYLTITFKAETGGFHFR